MGEPEGESVAGGPEMRDEVVVQFRYPFPHYYTLIPGEPVESQLEGKCYSSEGKGFPNGSVSVLLWGGKKVSPLQVLQICSHRGRFPQSITALKGTVSWQWGPRNIIKLHCTSLTQGIHWEDGCLC